MDAGAGPAANRVAEGEVDQHEQYGRAPALLAIEQAPEVGLLTALVPLRSVIPNLDFYANDSLDFADDMKDKAACLSRDQLAAVNLYTREFDVAADSLYRRLNAALRSPDRNQLVPPFAPYVRLLQTALARLRASSEGAAPRALWRGVKAAIAHKFEEGSLAMFWGFSSCTAKSAVLSNDLFLGQQGDRTLFSISTDKAVRVSHLSFFPNEEEFLLPLGVKFVVTSKLDMGNGLAMVELLEQGQAESTPRPVSQPGSAVSNPQPHEERVGRLLPFLQGLQLEGSAEDYAAALASEGCDSIAQLAQLNEHMARAMGIKLFDLAAIKSAAHGGGPQAMGNQEGSWAVSPGVMPQPLPALRAARKFLAAAVTSSNVVVAAGGEDANANLASVERLRPGDSAWRGGLSIPTARNQCAACAVGNVVVVVGGRSSTLKVLDVVEAVDTATGVHTALPALPKKRSGCGVVVVQGKMVVTGGSDAWWCRKDAWALDVGADGGSVQPRAQWATLPKMARSRCFHGTTAGRGYVFVCGGFNNSGGAVDTCERLQLGEREWQALPPMPTRLAFAGCCFGGGNVFVVGGSTDQPQRSVLALSVGEWRWTRVAELATGRFGCAAVCVGRRVMVLGGNDGSVDLSSCEVLEF